MSGASWLSYSLQDFLMFGPEVFLRLFVRLNQEQGGWVLLACMLALLIPWLASRPGKTPRRGAVALCGGAFVPSGLVFLHGYYAPINWPAGGFGWAFLIQGAALVMAALAPGRVKLPEPWRKTEVLIWTVIVGVFPWITAFLLGDWRGPGLFALAPDVTAAASLVLIRGMAGWLRWVLVILPVIWALFSALTYVALGLPLLLIAPIATVGLAVWVLCPRAGRNGGRAVSCRP
ncbi:MAG: hypothetical protein VX939_10255 [Pseudomonadota bacterium]|nr:hypothetical protein [Pseudomonadota bacterium]